MRFKFPGRSAILSLALITTSGWPQPAVDSSRDVARIKSVIEAIGVFADFGEFEAICQLYDSESFSDYSSLWGNEPTTGDPSNRATGWSGFIPGFDVTRHRITVEEVAIDGNTATANAAVVAQHWLDDQTWHIEGTYDVVLVRKGATWLISRWVFTLLDETGDRALVDLAEDRARDLIERPIACGPLDTASRPATTIAVTLAEESP